MTWLGLLSTSLAAGAWCGQRFAVTDETGVVIHDGDLRLRFDMPEQPTALGWQPDCRRLAVAAHQLVLLDFHFPGEDPNFRTVLAESHVSGTGPRGEELVWFASSVAYVEQSSRPELRVLDTDSMSWVSIAQTTQAVTDLALSGPRSGSFVLGEKMLWRFDPEKTVMLHLARRVAVHPETEAIEGSANRLSVGGLPYEDEVLLIGLSQDGRRALVRLDPSQGGPFASVEPKTRTTFTAAPDPNRLDEGWSPDGTLLVGASQGQLVVDDGTTQRPLGLLALEVAEVHVSPEGDRAAVVKTSGAVSFHELAPAEEEAVED